MIGIKIDDHEVMEALRKLQASGADMGPVMANIAAALHSESERQFRAESGPLGKWPELSEVTRALRGKKGTGKMLQLTAGGLAASVLPGHDARSAWIGSNKPYAAMHFFGGVTSPKSMIPNKRIPPRPYLPVHPETGELSAEARLTIMEILNSHLSRALGG
jgi:phage virion morphogenesis protein